MSIFYAIGHLIELVGNMAKPPPAESSGGSSDPNSGSKDGGGVSKKTPTCPPPPPKSSTAQPSNESEGEGDAFDIGDLLPDMNLNTMGDEEDGENEPGKTFIEILFSFVLDPLTAIIKGIIKMVELAIITVNIAMHLGKCAKWFVLYVFFTLIYIPISMLFALLNLSALEKKIWNTLYAVDAALFCVIEKVRGQGFHVVKFSDEIRSVCFLETVKPTDCRTKNSGKTKKSKRFNLASLLGSQLFLFLVILFVCVLFYILGKPGVNATPISFIVFFVIIVLIMAFIIISTFTSYILYMIAFLILPIALFVLSFFFGYIPYTLFQDFYIKELIKSDEAKTKYIPYLYYCITYGLHAFVGWFYIWIFRVTMDRINPLPVMIQYLISAACFFVTFMLIMIIIVIFSSLPSNDEDSAYMGFVDSVNTAFSL